MHLRAPLLGLGLLIAAVAAGACLTPAAPRCADGSYCPSGSVCGTGDEAGMCLVEPAGCATATDGTPCDGPGHSLCIRGECGASTCNDGFLDPAVEECDLGDANSDQPDATCRRNCRHARCGDNIVDPQRAPAELCDLGESNSAVVADRCRLDCRPAYCGDRVVDTGESPSCMGGFTTVLEDYLDYVAPLVVDLDRDGRDDLVHLRYDEELDVYDVVLSYGRRDGGFEDVVLDLDLPTEAFYLAAGDVDGDGRLDLAVNVNRFQDPYVQLLVATGARAFAAGATQPMTVASDVLLADLDGNGVTDLITFDRFDVYVRLGSEGGGFGEETTVSTSEGSIELIAAHLDDDDDMDLLAGGKHGAIVLRGQGDGNFVETVALTVDETTDYFAVADMNRDGRNDIVALGVFGAVNVYVWNALSGGAFSEPATYPLGQGDHGSLGVGDLEHDGDPDVVVTWTDDLLAEHGTTRLLRNLGNGVLAPEAVPALAEVPSSEGIVLVDIDRDGFLDFLLVGANDSALHVAHGGDGPLGPVVEIDPQHFDSPYMVDFDGDGLLDAIFDRLGSFDARRNLGSLAFGPPLTIFDAGDIVATDVETGDFDEDGHADLVMVTRTTVVTFRGDGTGHFAELERSAFAAFDARFVAAARLDADAHLDLIATVVSAADDPATLVLLRGDGKGGFSAAETIVPAGEHDARVTDLDRDGAADLLTIAGDGLGVRLGDGTGGFEARALLVAGASAFTTGDLDGDERIDLVVATSTAIEAWFGRGDAPSFERRFTTPFAGVFELRLGDLDGDGAPELFVLHDQLSLYVGAGAAGFHLPRVGLPVGVDNLDLVDVNGDGRPDLVYSQIRPDGDGRRVLVHAGRR